MKFLKNNLNLIILVGILLIGSNLLTGISVNSLSKKDARKIQKKLDSLDIKYKKLDFIHIQQLEYRRKIFLEDSLLQVKYLQEKIKDKVLIIQQAEALNKFKKNSSKINISKLDSAYEAEN